MPEIIAPNPNAEADMDVAAELERREAIVGRGLRNFVEVGAALMEIRDLRLYRDAYGSFEDYCRERWDMSRVQAHRLIESSRVVGNLLPIGNTAPANECQVRHLARLGPGQQQAAWSRAVETAPGGKLTGAHVKSIVDEMFPRDGPVDADPPWSLFAELRVAHDAIAKLLERWPEDKRSLLGEKLIETGQELIDTGGIC